MTDYEIEKERTVAHMLSALRAVKSAHNHVETCDMPSWLEEVESAIDRATQ